MRRFYRAQDRRAKTYRVIEENEKFATANPNSVLARKLYVERELALDAAELAVLDARAAKAELDRENAQRDPWAAYRLY